MGESFFVLNAPSIIVLISAKVIQNADELNVDPTSVSIGGLSAGGHMSAVLAHFARDEGISLKLQLLVVPATDMRYCPIEGDINPDTCQYKSVVDLVDMPWGPAKREQWFLNYFIGKDPLKRERILSDWRMTPVLAPSFMGLAPAHIVTAEFDVERDEGEYYGELLQKGREQSDGETISWGAARFCALQSPRKGSFKK